MDYKIYFDNGHMEVKNVQSIEVDDDEVIFYNATDDIVAIVNKDKYNAIKES